MFPIRSGYLYKLYILSPAKYGSKYSCPSCIWIPLPTQVVDLDQDKKYRRTNGLIILAFVPIVNPYVWL